MAHDGHSVAGAGVAMIGAAGERDAVADDAGNYRFDEVVPGEYEMYVSAESAPAPCDPGQPCVGTAIALERRPVTIQAGQTLTEDWEYPFDSVPTETSTSTAPSTTTTR